MKKNTLLENFLLSLGETVKKRRLELGLSQEELAERCCIHRTYVSDIENGKRNFTFACLYKVAHGLDLKPLELIEQARPPRSNWNRVQS